MKKILYPSLLLGLALSSCEGADDIPTSFNDVYIRISQSHRIGGDENIEWVSENPLIAAVEGNFVTAVHAGTTTIQSTQGKFKVTVKPRISVFVDPCLDWGSDDMHVALCTSQYLPDDYTDSTIIFTNLIDSHLSTVYTLYDNRLCKTTVTLDATGINLDRLVNHLTDRYITDTPHSYTSPDSKTKILLTQTPPTYTLTYLPK